MVDLTSFTSLNSHADYHHLNSFKEVSKEPLLSTTTLNLIIIL